MSELKLRVESIEANYRKRSRVISFLTSLNSKDETDLAHFNMMRYFSGHLEELQTLDENGLPKIKMMSGNSLLTDVDGKNGNLEVLSLTKSMKISDARDVSLNILFDGGNYLHSLPVESDYRIWHKIAFQDVDNDGVMELLIKSFNYSSITTNKEPDYFNTTVFDLSNGSFKEIER